MVLVLLFLLLVAGLKTTASHSVGVCYGRVADNLPAVNEVIQMYHKYGISRMRIYDHDAAVINALRGSNIELVIGVPNNEIQALASGSEAASNFVQQYIKIYIPDVKFRYIVVGNEIDPNVDSSAQFVLQAMQNINNVLVSSNLGHIKVSTSIAMSLLGKSYPPSTGEFSLSSRNYTQPIVGFLVHSGAPLLANVYSYFSYIGDTKNIDLSFALMKPSSTVIQDGNYVYKNLFEASLGALYAALNKVQAPDLEVVVSESGWPSSGGIAATVENAQSYYQGVINYCATQERPNKILETYLFALFDEDLKGPAETEKHFGLLSSNGARKYTLKDNACPMEPTKGSDNPSSSTSDNPSSSSSHLASGGIFISLFISSLVFFWFW